MSHLLVRACLAILLLSACDRASPTRPSGPPANGPRGGVWLGTVSDSVNGIGSLRLVLKDAVVDGERSLLSGSWTTTYADPARNSGGALSGTVTGGSASLILSPSTAPSCSPGTPFGAGAGSYVAVNVSAGDSTMTGAYVYGTCSGTANGSLDLRKQ